MSEVVDVVQEGESSPVHHAHPTSTTFVADSMADVKLESETSSVHPSTPTPIPTPTPTPAPAVYTSLSASSPSSTPSHVTSSPSTLPQTMPLPRGIMDDTTLIVHTKDAHKNVNSFTVSVTDPERKGEGMYQYMSYKCHTLTETSDGTVMQSSVVRRFSDFVWLHERLHHKYKGVLIPPIPEKAIIGRFSVEFLNERRRGLETFLNRIGAHPELRNDADVHLFLHGDETSLAVAKDSPITPPASTTEDEKHSSAVSKTAKAGRGIMSFFKESIQTISNTFGATKEREKTADDVACDKVDDYATHLETQLTAVHTNMEALIKRNRGLAKTWFEFGLSCTLLGQFESSVKEQTLGNMFAQVGNCADQLSVLINKRVDAENTKFREPLKDYIRLAESVKQMMKARATVAQQYQTALINLENNRTKLSSASGKPGSEDRLLSIERQVQETQQIVDQRFQELNRVTDKSLAEYQRFKQEKESDIKKLMVEFVKLQIEHAKKTQTAWESILPELDQLP